MKVEASLDPGFHGGGKESLLFALPLGTWAWGWESLRPTGLGGEPLGPTGLGEEPLGATGLRARSHVAGGAQGSWLGVVGSHWEPQGTVG